MFAGLCRKRQAALNNEGLCTRTVVAAQIEGDRSRAVVYPTAIVAHPKPEAWLVAQMALEFIDFRFRQLPICIGIGRSTSLSRRNLSVK